MVTLSLACCENGRAGELGRSEMMMDTVVDIRLRGCDREDIDAAFAEMRRVETTMTRFSDSSELSRINAKAGKGRTPVSENIWEVIEIALQVAAASEGAFDPTVGPAVDLWAKKRKEPPTEEELKKMKIHIGWRKIKTYSGRRISLDTGMSLNLDGIAKGFAVDKALDTLKKRNCKAALINAGGDIGCYAADNFPEWVIAVEGVSSGASRRPKINLRKGAVATSGEKRRFYVIGKMKFSRVLDPRTLRPTPGIVTAAAAITKTVAEADAWATAAMVGAKDILHIADAHRVGIALEKKGGDWNFNRAWRRRFEPPYPHGKP